MSNELLLKDEPRATEDVSPVKVGNHLKGKVYFIASLVLLSFNYLTGYYL